MPSFDWYQGTIYGHKASHIAQEFHALVDMSDMAPCTPRNGYLQGVSIVRGPTTHVEIWHEGNPGVHVKTTGIHAKHYAHLLQQFAALPSRVDVCEDFIQEGMADQLFLSAARFAQANGVKVNQQGDWIRGQSRTLYLGSRKSTAQLVIYEKGHQLGLDPNWVRLEVRNYPKSRQRESLVGLTEGEWLYASPWIGRFLSSLGWEQLAPQAAGTLWRPTDTDRARLSLIRQYGRIMEDWSVDVGGWENLGKTLASSLDDHRKNKNTHDHSTLAAQDFDSVGTSIGEAQVDAFSYCTLDAGDVPAWAE